MPWELEIWKESNRAKAPLGLRAEVESTLSEVLPSVQFYREPSGDEKLVSMDSRGMKVPDVIRQAFQHQPGAFRGIFERDGLTFELDLGGAEEVKSIHLDIRGHSAPMPYLTSLVGATGWKVFDLSTEREAEASDWRCFLWPSFRRQS